MAKANKANFLQVVKEQYEDYPYPPRDPKEEKAIIRAPFIDMIERLNHYCFGGKRDFTKKFRILVAGGGTGDSSVFMAEQYGLLGAEIVHLDLSKASIAVAKERLKERGLEGKVTFLHASLLDIPKMDLGKFDYINCSGVLHHLESPEAGLAALESALAPDGVMAIMVYGKYGRLAVYPMQQALALATKHITNRAEKVKIARSVFNNIPGSNWFLFMKHIFDWDLGTDNGFYDLLLHPQDRAYSIPEIYEYLATANLKSLSIQDENTSGEFLLDPKRFIMDEDAQAEVDKLSLPEKQALAELLAGNMYKHTFYTARKPLVEPDPKDEDFVPTVNYMFSAKMKSLLKLILMAQSSPIMCTNQSGGNHTIMIDILPSTAALVVAIDGKRTIRQIIDEVSRTMNLPRDEVAGHFQQLYKDFKLHDLLFLRHSSVPEYQNIDVLHTNMLQRTAKK